MVLVTILILPFLGAAAIAVGRGRRSTAWVAVATNGAALILGILAAIRVVREGPISGGWGVLRADALSVFMVIVIGAISLLSSWLGIQTMTRERDEEHGSPVRSSVYGMLVQAFVGFMLLAVLAANVGVLWVAVEATTIVTVFLVGHRRTRGSLEAAWKYIVICSVGIALAFLGTVLVYLAALHAGGHSAHALDWTSLVAHAHRFDPSLMRLAFGLLVLGYGTKVGLAPMHSWLPDAHSQAPAPVSALMSGVLLTVAFYAILRFKAVTDVAVGPGFARTLLVVVGLLSLALAASLLITQRDYKRMLAYHSIEHMGLIALGAAAGIRLAIAAVLLHILGHGLAKSVLFLTSGEIMAAEGTSQIDGVRALYSPQAGPGWRVRSRSRGAVGSPALQPLHQRARDGAGRVRGGVGLGRRPRHGRDGGHLHRGGGSRPSHAPGPALVVASPRTAASLDRRTSDRWLGRLRLHRGVRLAALWSPRGGGAGGGAVTNPRVPPVALEPIGRHRRVGRGADSRVGGRGGGPPGAGDAARPGVWPRRR